MWASLQKTALCGIDQEPLLVRAGILQEMHVIQPGDLVLARCFSRGSTRRARKPQSVKRPSATRTGTPWDLWCGYPLSVRSRSIPALAARYAFDRAAPEHPDSDEAEAPDFDEPVGVQPVRRALTVGV